MGSPHTPPPSPAVAAIVRQVVLDTCPTASVSGAWCVAGSRGAVLVRFHHAGEVHVATTHRLRFDLSGPFPRLVVADPPRIVPPLSRTWSPTLGGYVEQLPHVEPVEVAFAAV